MARRHVVFLICATALLFSSINNSMVAVALTGMVRDLNTSLAWIGWVLTAYSLAQAVVMPIAGKLADEVGRKRAFLVATALFTLGSLGSAIAPNVYLLIVARVVQAIGGGSFMPICSGIVSDEYGENRTRAIGLFSSVFPLGGILGPSLGGIIVDQVGWRGTFWFSVPCGVLVFLLGLFVLSEMAQRQQRQPIDVIGISMFTSSLIAIMYAMTDIGLHQDVSRPLVWGPLLGGLLLLVLFVRYEAGQAAPVLDVSLLGRRPFLYTNLLNFFYGFTIFGVFSLTPLYAASRYGFSSALAGAMLMPRAVAMMLFSTATALLLPRTGYRKPMLIGLALFALSMFLMSFGFTDLRLGGVRLPNAVTLAVIILLSGVGLGIAGPAANNAAIELMPDKVAAITGLRGMFRNVGGLIGTAVMVMLVQSYTDQAEGLEESFLGIAIVMVLVVMPLVFGVPDKVGRFVRPPSAEAALPPRARPAPADQAERA